MKKIFLILFLYFASLSGQENIIQKKWNWGVRGGLSAGAPIPNKLEENEDGELGIGPLAGAFVKYHFTNNLYVEANLYYDSRGNSPYTKQYRRDTIVNVKFGSTTTQLPTFYNAWVAGELKLRYLTLPIIASWKLKKWIALQIGSQINYLLKASDKGTAKIIVGEGGVVDDIYREYQNANDINTWDYGGNTGISFYFFPELELQIRYSKSIRSIYRDGFFKDNNQVERKFLNSNFQISVNYQLK
jgi:hypothetical protein